MGIRVVDENRSRIGLYKATGRNLGKVVTGIIFLKAFGLIFLPQKSKHYMILLQELWWSRIKNTNSKVVSSFSA